MTKKAEENIPENELEFVKKKDLLGHNFSILGISKDFTCNDNKGKKGWVKSFHIKDEDGIEKSFLVNSGSALDGDYLMMVVSLKLIKSEKPNDEGGFNEYYVFGPPIKK